MIYGAADSFRNNMLVGVTHSLAAILEVWTVAKNSWCAFFKKKLMVRIIKH